MRSKLFYVGFTDKDAPLSIRQRLRTTVEDRRVMLARLEALASERMILSTCERFEVYALTTQANASAWAALLAEWFDASAEMLAQHVRLLQGSAVAEHMLRVAAGLESRILGEPHILGQVRDAFFEATRVVETSRAEGTIRLRAAGPVLNALARSAIHTGKRIRNETSINANARSIVTVALGRIERVLGAISTRTALIVGTGRLARNIAAALAGRRIRRLIFASRNADRAVSLARKFRAVGLGFGRLAEGLAQSDFVITCTCSPPVILDRSTVGEVAGRKLCILDLGVPHNVHHSVGQLPGVQLSHLDELLSKETVRYVSREADRIVVEELARFTRWYRERALAPIIAERVRRLRDRDVPDARLRNRALHAQIMRIKAGVTT